MPHHGQHRAPHSHLTAPSFPAPRGAHGWHPPPALVPSGQGTWAQLRPPSAACRASSSSCLEKNNFRQGGEGKGDKRRRRGWRETLLGCRHAPLGIHHRLGPPLPRHTQALSLARLTAGPSPARQLRHTKSRSEQWSRAAQPSQLPPPAPSTPEGSAGRRAHRWVFRDPPCRCRDTRQPQPHRTALPLRNALPAAGSPSPDPHPRGLGCVLPCGSTEPCPAVPTVERGRRPSLPSWGRQLLQGPPRHAGVGALRGCARTSETLLPPSSSASPLTLLLEESQKRGEVPAHENHHGGQEEGLLPAGRGSAAAYRAGGRMPRPQLFLPTLVRAAGPAAGRPAGGCSPGGAAARGEAGAGGGMRGGRRGQPGCSQRAPGAGRRRAGPLLWPPAPPGPPPPPARSVRGRTLPGMGLSAENSPQILVLGGESPRIIHISQDWSPPDTAALQTGVLAFTALWLTGRSWEAFPPQASTFGTCCSRAGRAGAPTSPL